MSSDMTATTGTETFGQRVKALRLKKGIRQVDLAERAGLSWRHLIRIEQDAGGTTKAATAERLAEALDVEVTELTGDRDDEEDRVPPRQSLSGDLQRLAQLAGILERRPGLLEDVLAAEAEEARS